jgi:hypothetical protein
MFAARTNFGALSSIMFLSIHDAVLSVKEGLCDVKMGFDPPVI